MYFSGFEHTKGKRRANIISKGLETECSILIVSFIGYSPFHYKWIKSLRNLFFPTESALGLRQQGGEQPKILIKSNFLECSFVKEFQVLMSRCASLYCKEVKSIKRAP